MAKIKPPKSAKAGKGVKIALVVAEYNREITQELKKNCLKELKKAGVNAPNLFVTHVPGAFEIPYMCQRVIKSKKPHAVIALGCIIKGKTPHFDFIAYAASQGIIKVSLKYDIPIVFGVLTTLNLTQARARINKGREAARSAIQILNANTK